MIRRCRRPTSAAAAANIEAEIDLEAAAAMRLAFLRYKKASAGRTKYIIEQ